MIAHASFVVKLLSDVEDFAQDVANGDSKVRTQKRKYPL